jgi:hypothetical protein
MKNQFNPESITKLGYVNNGGTWELPRDTRRDHKHAEYKRWYNFFKALTPKAIEALIFACKGVDGRNIEGWKPKPYHLVLVKRMFRLRKQRQDKDRGKYTWYYRLPAVPYKALKVVVFELDLPLTETQNEHYIRFVPCRGYKAMPRPDRTDVAEAVKAIQTIQSGFDALRPAFHYLYPSLTTLSRRQMAWEFNSKDSDELNYTREFKDKRWVIDVPHNGQVQVLPVILEYTINGVRGKMQSPADEIYRNSDKLLDLFSQV